MPFFFQLQYWKNQHSESVALRESLRKSFIALQSQHDSLTRDGLLIQTDVQRVMLFYKRL